MNVEIIIVILLAAIVVLVIMLALSIRRNRSLEHYLYVSQRDARRDKQEREARIRELHRELGLPEPSHPYDFLTDSDRREVEIRAGGDWDLNPDPSG